MVNINENSTNLCLAMMIKNEEKTILKSLNSCKNIVSCIKIYDTGSTDSTLDILEIFSNDNPTIKLDIIKGEFINFAESRNVLLEFVDKDESIDFVLLLDSNDELQGHDAFLKLINGEKSKTKDNTKYYCSGYLLRQKWNCGNSVDSYFNIRLIRPRHNWRYNSPVHEYISSTSENEVVSMRIDDPNIIIYQDRTQDCESSFTRFSRDKDILLKEHLKNPEDPRIVFYLAQTYGSLGMVYDAYYFYKLRIELNGYEEERFHSFLRLGEIAQTLNMDSSVFLGWWTKALEHTSRVEPIVKIVNYYLFTNTKYYIAGMYTTLGLSFEYPVHCNLFVNRLDYDYTRYHLDGIVQYYLGHYKQGHDSCLKAIEYTSNLLKDVDMNQQQKQTLEMKLNLDKNNLNFYIEKLTT